MREFQVILVLLFAALFSYVVSGRLVSTPVFRRSLRLVLILFVAFAMLDFTRVWVFPLCFGLLVGNLLAWEGRP
ncbi:MAG: hypothetical protein GX493_05120 [Firmicutes bacterium]|nr:hypothetical protein [Bacillota bacterium]